jgi:HSP20 family protein
MLTRYDPFREMMTLRSAMDSLVDKAFVGSRADLESVNWGLALDVSETGDEYLVKASVPGVNPDDLEITYNNKVLTIKGETQQENEVEETRYHLRERRFGSFARSVSLPIPVDSDHIEASYENGVLSLRLPKTEASKPRRISISSPEKMIEGKVADIKTKN